VAAAATEQQESSMVEATFFRKPADLRRWFEKHHDTAAELWVGYYKKGSGKPSITWPESVDEALCVGWIDGIRKGIDEVSYRIRFTPRRATSVWSAINIERVRVLTAEGRMRPGGLRAFEGRKSNRVGIYSYEQRSDQLPEPYASALKRRRAAWSFFQTQPPSYRKAVGWWIVSAKREETRQRRLATLIEDCVAGRRIAGLRPLKKSS
jgi:uncharacterized protein YdeI (YjbR/CyaY-like superfamily)